MNFRNAFLAATMLALPLAAHAQPVNGLYVGLGAGLNIMQDEPVTSFGGLSTNGSNLETNLGGMGVTSLGWGFGNGLRAEMEFSLRYNGLNKVNTPGGSFSIGGSEQKFGPMVNVLYDFTTLSPSFSPYVGAGVGYQWADEHASIGGISDSQSKGAFAYQAILGAAIPVSATPGFALTAEYRFMGLSGNRDYSGIQLGNDFNHSILIGVRYAFGAAPAPAPAAPAPVAAMPSPVSRS
jgi:OOP family OmpA-OmpF porin